MNSSKTIDSRSEATRNAIRLAKELRKRIPFWIQELPTEKFIVNSTPCYGILGKCCDYTEQLLKHVLLLLEHSIADAQIQFKYDLEKVTLGETVKRIKSLQKDCRIFQTTDRQLIGKTFALLDEIVTLRNNLIHSGVVKITNRRENEIVTLLDAVNELCKSWLIEELLGESYTKVLCLVVLDEDNRGIEHHLVWDDRITIGRNNECMFCSKHDDISRRHCVVTWEGEMGLLEDLESSNGTYLNGKRVFGQSPIKVGDVIGIGNIRLMIELIKLGDSKSKAKC